ncbi:MAG: response regulator [Pseudomonadota bacterium]
MTDATPHILVVDDHRDIREPLGRYLERSGFRTSLADGGASMRRILKAAAIDLIVLDIMMPGEDGLALCRDLRAKGSEFGRNGAIPVILLTARDDEMDRIVGLEIGADDYVTKPFSPRELLARIKAVLRRSGEALDTRNAPASGHLRFDRWRFDLARRELLDETDVAIPLSATDFRLLKTFVERPGMVLSRARLLDLTSGRAAQAFDRSIDNQVSRLRRKIERNPKEPTLIKTVWADGYVFAGKVSQGPDGNEDT